MGAHRVAVRASAHRVQRSCKARVAQASLRGWWRQRRVLITMRLGTRLAVQRAQHFVLVVLSGWLATTKRLLALETRCMILMDDFCRRVRRRLCMEVVTAGKPRPYVQSKSREICACLGSLHAGGSAHKNRPSCAATCVNAQLLASVGLLAGSKVGWHCHCHRMQCSRLISNGCIERWPCSAGGLQ